MGAHLNALGLGVGPVEGLNAAVLGVPVLVVTVHLPRRAGKAPSDPLAGGTARVSAIADERRVLVARGGARCSVLCVLATAAGCAVGEVGDGGRTGHGLAVDGTVLPRAGRAARVRGVRLFRLDVALCARSLARVTKEAGGAALGHGVLAGDERTARVFLAIDKAFPLALGRALKGAVRRFGGSVAGVACGNAGRFVRRLLAVGRGKAGDGKGTAVNGGAVDAAGPLPVGFAGKLGLGAGEAGVAGESDRVAKRGFGEGVDGRSRCRLREGTARHARAIELTVPVTGQRAGKLAVVLDALSRLVALLARGIARVTEREPGAVNRLALGHAEWGALGHAARQTADPLALDARVRGLAGEDKVLVAHSLALVALVTRCALGSSMGNRDGGRAARKTALANVPTAEGALGIVPAAIVVRLGLVTHLHTVFAVLEVVRVGRVDGASLPQAVLVLGAALVLVKQGDELTGSVAPRVGKLVGATLAVTLDTEPAQVGPTRGQRVDKQVFLLALGGSEGGVHLLAGSESIVPVEVGHLEVARVVILVPELIVGNPRARRHGLFCRWLLRGSIGGGRRCRSRGRCRRLLGGGCLAAAAAAPALRSSSLSSGRARRSGCACRRTGACGCARARARAQARAHARAQARARDRAQALAQAHALAFARARARALALVLAPAFALAPVFALPRGLDSSVPRPLPESLVVPALGPCPHLAAGCLLILPRVGWAIACVLCTVL
eukprot:m.294206 g.294206  ORF g.294206 m.294206 type:complete len:728 (-) comp19501_c11_seq1:847-3030(-)